MLFLTDLVLGDLPQDLQIRLLPKPLSSSDLTWKVSCTHESCRMQRKANASCFSTAWLSSLLLFLMQAGSCRRVLCLLCFTRLTLSLFISALALWLPRRLYVHRARRCEELPGVQVWAVDVSL